MDRGGGLFSARGASFGARRVGGGVAMEGSLDVGLVGCEMAHSYLPSYPYP